MIDLFLFIAMNYRILVYILDTIHSPFKCPIKTLACSHSIEAGGGADSPHAINRILVSRLLDKEVLVSVSDMGDVCIWRTDSLDEPPMILSNESSTWGIAVHGEQGLIAVSANDWKITVFNILEMTRSNPIFGRREENCMGNTEKIELSGHEHNIPNIDFNKSGRYLASSSIDMTCKIWDIKTRRVVSEKRMGYSGTGEEPW
ncbi:WD40-repeat-containing domain protein [Pilobolus umbonatus]|nr:WD40-repeat-containing domain protein [Pilobolus umbonatus]